MEETSCIRNDTRSDFTNSNTTLPQEEVLEETRSWLEEEVTNTLANHYQDDYFIKEDKIGEAYNG
jgi:hypothetical protein